MALSPLGFAQTSTTGTPLPPPSSPSPEKKKKVWTEDDLRRMQGGVSVVGEADKPPAKKKKTAPDDTAKAEEPLPEEPPEQPPCKSWSWASAVNAALSAQGVNFGREYWVQKCYGGEICTTELGNVAALAKRVGGDYALEDASKILVQAETFAGIPPDFPAADKKGIPHIVIWKRHPYVITDHHGIIYTDENGNVTGYWLQDMTMVDLYEDRTVRFNHQSDSLQNIQAVARFTVKPR